ncbi:sugar ABC transporter substrate-binding protein [Kribbella sp. CA-253562]|uniref:sugar ABC transporter substrate-binding protein n=1 Tax=Kribbella sp. CA-253562 TaxID=3239942 RepID=UPI003D8CF4F3
MKIFSPLRLAACGLLLTLAACSDPAAAPAGSTAPNDSGTDTSAATAAVTAAKAPQTTWTGPTTPVTPPAGRRIVAITCGSQGYGCVQGARGVAAAGQVVGWDVSIVDGKGDPSVWNAAVTQAVTDRADGIVLAAINPALVQDGLAKAKAAGVPVVVQFIPELPGAKVDAHVTTDHLAGGKTLADWVIADSGGQAKVLLLEEPAFPELVRRNDGIRAQLQASCPGCTIVSTTKFSIGTMVQQLPGLVTTALQSHPEITHILAPFDSSGTFAAQGIRQAARKVALVSGEGDPDGLTRLRKGEQAADLATVPAWAGWAAVDQLARLFTGAAVQPHVLPQRLFTADNVPAEQGSWRGDLDYAAQFSKLWGK